MQKRHEFTPFHLSVRLERCHKILIRIKNGTLPSLVCTDEKKFDVQQSVNNQNFEFEAKMVWRNLGECLDAKIFVLWSFGWQLRLREDHLWFLSLLGWKSLVSAISLTFWTLNYFPGHKHILTALLGHSNKTLFHHRIQKRLKFRKILNSNIF